MPSTPSRHAHGPSEIWKRAGARVAIAAARKALASRLRLLREERGLTQEAAAELAGLHAKHLQRIERGSANATIATLAALCLAYGVGLDALFSREPPRLPFRKLPESDAAPYVNCVPLYSLKAAAGLFGPAQEIEPEGQPQSWVAPSSKVPPAKNLFVAQVFGESMNRRIPNGAYCLFRAPVRRIQPGEVVLVQHRGVRDPDHGGRYTVKVYRPRGGKVVLEPDSSLPGYKPIELPALEELTAIAALVEVLPGDES